MNPFIFEKSNNDLEEKSIRSITNFISDHFESMGISYEGKVILIQNRQIELSPIFCPKSQNPQNQYDIIILNVKNYTYWAQVIYQLSHEITHCMVHILSQDGTNSTPWIEETICEAMSYYFLCLFSEEWSKCELARERQDYSTSIAEYLCNCLKENVNHRLGMARDVSELIEINNTAQDCRIDRKAEARELFNIIKANPDNILGLMKYRDFIIDNTVLLNTESYRSSYPVNSAVAYICDIQDRIMNGSKQ